LHTLFIEAEVELNIAPIRTKPIVYLKCFQSRFSGFPVHFSRCFIARLVGFLPMVSLWGNYRPLDNEFQIRESLINMCDLINSKSNVFEKALLALVLISYIQPFIDGNKRTARIVSNAILMNNKYCPISFRTVDSVKYKKAMLLFYEQNNISVFKEIFINQFEFAVNTYF
jgi:hypothetical protein